MADIIRVKAKKQFQWDQDNKFIFIKIPMAGHTTIKNLQIYLSDLILRLTSKQKKSSQTLDFPKQIEYLSPQNKFTLIDGVVNATLKKKVPEKWDHLLIEDISLAELKNRRKESEFRYEQNIKEAELLKEKLRSEYDRKATQEYMRFQEEERRKLDKKKEQEKQAALNEVFRNVNERTGKIQHQSTKWQQKGTKALQQLQKQQQQQHQRQKQARKKQQHQKFSKVSSIPSSQPTKNSIFTEEDIAYHEQIRSNVKEQIQQIPIRKQAKVNVKFTQKLYPLVATRDYHYTEPPMPKGSAPLPPSREGDLESRNPLWLKDRGDGFMRMKNYGAALDAYNQAIKIDPNQRKILMNRSLAQMKLLNFDSALTDCQTILHQMQKQVLGNQQQKQQSLLDLVKINTRKALCLAHKGHLQKSKQLLTSQLQFQLPQQTRKQIQESINKIQRREESIIVKIKGDQCVKRQQYAAALQYYDQAIQIDNNQYALSNKGLCLNKVAKFQQAVEVCDRGVRLVEQFTSGVSVNNKNNSQIINMLMKLLYRKSTAHQSLNQLKQSQSSLQKALILNPQDKDIGQALKSLISQKESLQFQHLKQQASIALSQRNSPQQALTLYQKCLKLVQSSQKVQQYLSILQNQCVCYLKLQQYDNIISVSIRILSIVNNLKTKIIQFGDKKNTNFNKDILDKIVVRTLVRRANAYLKTNQLYNAKSDLEKAVDIDPSDQNVAKELQKLKDTIGAK